MTNYTRIQIRRGTASQWSANNPVLAVGEQALETDTYRVKIGDGTTRYNILPYQNQQGIQGPEGPQGEQGPTGPTGSFGGATFEYFYDNATSAPTTQLAGYVTFNALGTQMYISYLDSNETNIQSFLQTIDDSTSQIKGTFKLTSQSDPAVYAFFNITGTHTEHSDHYDVPVAFISSSETGTTPPDQDVYITFQRTGDIGDTGPQGPVGPAGAFYVMDAKPTSPINGQAWIDGATGFSYVYFNDRYTFC